MSEVVMMTLPEFLLARIAEDEAQARDADHEPLRYGVDVVTMNTLAERVLIECAVKREFVAMFVDAEEAVADYDPNARMTSGEWQEWGNRHAWAQVVEALAAVYRGHPDYRQEWRP